MQLKFNSDNNHANQLSDMLTEMGANAVTIESATNERVFAVGNEQPLWQQVIITAFFDEDANINYIVEFLANEQKITAAVEKIDLNKWQKNIQQQVHPMQYGDRLWVYPTNEKNLNNKKAVVILEPGLAFGTGSHPTTAMCLTWLDQVVEDGMTVIDYGCGTGILAIAACKLGATNVIAIDNDPQALQSTQQNADKNNVAKNLHIFTPESCPEIKADILIANILANPLIELAPTLFQLLKSNAQLALSGILDHQAEKVINNYQPYIQIKSVNQLQDWVLLSGAS